MPNQDFKLQASTYYEGFIAILSMASLMIILGLPLFWVYRFLLIIGLAGYTAFILNQPTINRLIFYQSTGKWVIEWVGKSYEGLLKKDSLLTTWLSVLRFKTHDGKLLSCVIFPDSLPKDTYRRLLITVKYGTILPLEKGLE